MGNVGTVGPEIQLWRSGEVCPMHSADQGMQLTYTRPARSLGPCNPCTSQPPTNVVEAQVHLSNSRAPAGERDDEALVAVGVWMVGEGVHCIVYSMSMDNALREIARYRAWLLRMHACMHACMQSASPLITCRGMVSSAPRPMSERPRTWGSRKGVACMSAWRILCVLKSIC